MKTHGTDSVSIEFVVPPPSASDVNAGRPPSRGSVRITTADGTEQYELELFTYSVNQFIEAVPELLEGGHGGISTEDTTYIVLEREDETNGHITVCYSRETVPDPGNRLLPREERSLDAVVPLSVLVDAVLTALRDLLEQIEEINQNVDDSEWYQELQTDFEEVRELAADHLR